MVIEADPPIPNWPGLAGRKVKLASANDFINAPLREIYNWWLGNRQGQLPSLQDFDIAEHAKSAPNLYIAAEVDAGYELRLAGEEYQRLFDLKKGQIWRRDSEDPIMRDSAALLDWVSATGRALRTVGHLELSDRHWIKLEAVICPLAYGADGVKKILGCVAAIDSEPHVAGR